MGKKPEQYVRFRYDPLGDIGRIKRQQEFLQAFSKVDNDPLLLARLPQLIESTRGALTTNLTGDYLKQLIMWFQGLNERIIKMETMLRVNICKWRSYWEPDLETSREIVQKFFFARREDIENSREDSIGQESGGGVKAFDLVILDLRGLFPFSDYWLICSGSSAVQTKAVAEEVLKEMEECQLRPSHLEGMEEGEWIPH